MSSSLKQTNVPRSLWWFLNCPEDQIRTISPEQVSNLKNISDEFRIQFTGNQSFISFLAAVNNCLAFFGTAGMAFEELIECQNKLPTTPLEKKKFHHYQLGKIKQDFEKHRTYSKLFSDYQKAKEAFQEQMEGAYRFLVLAQCKLREC